MKKVRQCQLCGTWTELPYTCRPCWTYLPNETRIGFYALLTSSPSGSAPYTWLRQEMKRE